MVTIFQQERDPRPPEYYSKTSMGYCEKKHAAEI